MSSGNLLGDRIYLREYDSYLSAFGIKGRNVKNGEQPTEKIKRKFWIPTKNVQHNFE